MEFLVAILAIVVVCSGGALVLYARELRRIAHVLKDRSLESNGRLALGAPLPGLKTLIIAIDAHLAAERDRECDRKTSEQGFQAGLVGLSHDIRTPLAGAKGYVQLASDEVDPLARERYLTAASERLDAMAELLDQLFSYTRSESERASEALASVDAVAVLAEVLLGNLPVFEERNIAPTVALGDVPLAVRADEEALRRIFDNLISNMLKYGQAPFEIERKELCGGRKGAPGEAGLVFSNGVDPAGAPDLDRIFDRFYRADRARSTSGAGLGLAIVRNLCARSGIEIRVALDPASASSDHASAPLLFTVELAFHHPSSEAWQRLLTREGRLLCGNVKAIWW